jgi:hypothetical protein
MLPIKTTKNQKPIQSLAHPSGCPNNGVHLQVLDGPGFVLEPPDNPDPRVYMVALEMIFIPLASLDQRTSAYQGLLRHIGKCGKDPNLDRRGRLCAGCDRPKTHAD